ncbi:MAG TPA: hemolysin family protein [Dehalococcoidia bacterium]|nr:hemolysin family protein [Dehalococcoidia bacterium]
MTTGSIVALVILIAAVSLLIVETIAEAGVISLSRSRARLLASRDPDDHRAQRLNAIIQDREQTLGSFAVGRTLAVVTGLSSGLYILVAETGFDWETVVGTGVVGFVVVGVAQAIPRRLASISPEGFGLVFARTMDALDSLFVLPSRVMESPALIVSRFRSEQDDHAPAPTDIELLLEEGEGPELEEQERELIRRVIEIGETTVREAMIPRPDIVAVDRESSLSEAAQLVVDKGLSRLPVFEDNIDNIVGVLYAKDVLAELHAGRDTDVKDLMRQPLLVPESKLLDDLLAQFKALRIHIAIVLDEYGGTAGLVTIEDVLEEIVGEIEDEYDRFSAAPIVRLGANEAIVDGRAPLDSLTELFGWFLEDGESETVGGYVFDRLGKIPEVGDFVTEGELHLEVTRMAGRRISRIRAMHEPGAERPLASGES